MRTRAEQKQLTKIVTALLNRGVNVASLTGYFYMSEITGNEAHTRPLVIPVAEWLTVREVQHEVVPFAYDDYWEQIA